MKRHRLLGVSVGLSCLLFVSLALFAWLERLSTDQISFTVTKVEKLGRKYHQVWTKEGESFLIKGSVYYFFDATDRDELAGSLKPSLKYRATVAGGYPNLTCRDGMGRNLINCAAVDR